MVFVFVAYAYCFNVKWYYTVSISLKNVFNFKYICTFLGSQCKTGHYSCKFWFASGCKG